MGVGGVIAEPVEHYLRSFTWNKVKYRSDRSIAELIDSLQRVPSLSPPTPPPHTHTH